MQQPGTLIEGKYEILGKIREGGMGAIYKVRHRLLDEVRVVKVMQQNVVADEEMKRRFLEEARTATRLKHPNLCTIHDFALDEEGKAYLVMEFIDGMTVADLLRRKGPPGLSLSLEITHQALMALAYLHRKSVVHRDIDKGVGMTSTGVFLGKLKYASPEQYGSLPAGEKLDGRSDIYSLGVVLYELLTGKRPFVGESPTELLRAHLFEPPISFAISDPEGKIPPEVREAVLRALAKKREDRFASAEEFDRDVVSLEHRYSRPDDIEDSAKILTAILPSPSSTDVTVTPSAQNRLDMQFAASATPLPTRPKLTVVPPRSEDPGKTAIASSESLPAAEEAPPPRKTRRLLLVSVAVVAVGAGVAVWMSQRRPRPIPSRPSEEPAPAVTARVAPQPIAAPAIQPTSAPSEAAVSPAMPSPLPAAAPAEDAGPEKRLAERSRSEASVARRRAERAGAPQKVATLYVSGREREREGQQKLSRKDYAAARSAFDTAKAAFQNASTAAAVVPPKLSPRPAEQVAVQAAPTARAEAPRPAAVPTAAPLSEAPRESAKPPPPAPAEPPRREAGETERIRDTIRRYVEAQNALDVERYAKVFPSINRGRVQSAFESLRSQTLEVDIQKIDVVPGANRATVRGHERRVWVPKVGSEQRDSRTMTFQLEKRGDGWVITGLS